MLCQLLRNWSPTKLGQASPIKLNFLIFMIGALCQTWVEHWNHSKLLIVLFFQRSRNNRWKIIWSMATNDDESRRPYYQCWKKAGLLRSQRDHMYTATSPSSLITANQIWLSIFLFDNFCKSGSPQRHSFLSVTHSIRPWWKWSMPFTTSRPKTRTK
jgi:hypothetical protein